MAISFIIKVFLTLSWPFIVLGCNVGDDFMDDCYAPYMLRVLVSDDANDGFYPEFFAADDMPLMLEPYEVLVYVFSDEMKFLGSHPARVGDIIVLPYRNEKKIYAMAVSTAKGEPIASLFTSFEIGKTYSKTDLLFELMPVSKMDGYALSPTDFMYASDSFDINPNNDKNILYYLYLEPKIGAVKVVTKGVKEWANNTYGPSGLANDEFTFNIGKTQDRCAVNGELFGNEVGYLPPSYTVNTDSIVTPLFNLMPTEKGITVTIYRNGVKIYPPADDTKKIAYKVFPRSPYIIYIDFGHLPPDGGGGGFGIIPAKFDDIVIYRQF